MLQWLKLLVKKERKKEKIATVKSIGLSHNCRMEKYQNLLLGTEVALDQNLCHDPIWKTSEANILFDPFPQTKLQN